MGRAGTGGPGTAGRAPRLIPERLPGNVRVAMKASSAAEVPTATAGFTLGDVPWGIEKQPAKGGIPPEKSATLHAARSSQGHVLVRDTAKGGGRGQWGAGIFIFVTEAPTQL